MRNVRALKCCRQYVLHDFALSCRDAQLEISSFSDGLLLRYLITPRKEENNLSTAYATWTELEFQNSLGILISPHVVLVSGIFCQSYDTEAQG